MNVLTIIPARSGSKRVPGKNTKILDGKPLIAHTILAAQASQCSNEIMVSTDSEEIAQVARSYGASVPWLRPDNLAEDSSDVIHAVIDLIQRYKSLNQEFDSIILLQPTSPFRKSDTIRKALELHKSTGQSVVSVSLSSLKHSWYKTLDKNMNLLKTKIFNEEHLTQESPELYMLNGSIYISSVEQILTNQSFYSEPTKAFIIDSLRECIDIDTFYDWALAERLVELKEEVFL